MTLKVSGSFLYSLTRQNKHTESGRCTDALKLQINLVTKSQSMSPYHQQSLHSGESSDVGYTLKDKAEHRYRLVPSSVCGT